jgi:hypothetical protein
MTWRAISTRIHVIDTERPRVRLPVEERYHCEAAARAGRLQVPALSVEPCSRANRTALPAARPQRRVHTVGAAGAEGGHLEVMLWAREHECPWDWNMCSHLADESKHVGLAHRCEGSSLI